MLKKLFYTFDVEIEHYNSALTFCVSKDIKAVIKFAKKNSDITLTLKDFENTDCMFIYEKDKRPIVWLKTKPTTPLQRGDLSHELFHAVYELMRWIGTPLTQASEEPYAYLTGHITEKAYEQFKLI